MYIKNNNNRYTCTGYSPTANNVMFSGVEGLVLPITGTVSLMSEDDDLELAVQYCADYARQTYDNNVLTLTNEAEATAPTIEEIRTAKLLTLEGTCSGAITSGVMVSSKHYTLSSYAQINLSAMSAQAKNGQTTFLYHADDEAVTTYTAEQITAIATAASSWVTANTAYYDLLKTWAGRETDAAVLAAIKYGSPLPSDLMTTLVTLLTSVGINTSTMSALLTS